MPVLPNDAGPAAEFIVRHLCRPIEVAAGSCYVAAAETENASDGSWFWNDDNAKILEFMSRPDVWRRYPREGAELLRFVRSMCDGPFIFRRVGAPLLERIGREDGVERYRHSLLRLGWDAARGAVTVGLRFHDERDADNLTLCGGALEFTYRRRRYKEHLPASGSIASIEAYGYSLRLRSTAEMFFAPAWRRRPLGRVSYTYTFDARSMVFDVEAALAVDPGIEIGDAVLSIGHAGLEYCLFGTVASDAGDAPIYSAGAPSARLFETGAGYYVIRQGHISADALAIHTIPAAPSRLAGIETRVVTQGRLDTVLARYAFPGRHRGTRLAVTEHKLLTAGGFYDRAADYAALLRRAVAARDGARAALDFSISYDYGATLNAFAKCFAGATGDNDGLRALFDETLGHYDSCYVNRYDARPNAVFSRELAFAMLGTATMFRATGSDEYRRALTRLCDALLDLETRPDGEGGSFFRMRHDNPEPYLDCQSAALLALVQTMRVTGDERLPAAIERGLASYRVLPGVLDGGAAGMLDTLGIKPSGGAGDTARWNYKAGLTLRLFAALHTAPNPALRRIAAAHGERIAVFEAVLRRQLALSLEERGDCIEFRTSIMSRETNSETQPWVMLGLLGHPLD